MSVKWSGFPTGTPPTSSDKVVGLQGGQNVQWPATDFSLGGGIDTLLIARTTSISAAQNTVVTNGYRTVGDGGGATYVRATGAVSIPMGGFQSADGAYWSLVTDPANPLQFGATKNSTFITSQDIAANPQWIGPPTGGSYTAGVDSWDNVAIQECIYYCFANASTPGVITWNSVAGTFRLNKRFFCSTGNYEIYRQIYAVVQGYSFDFESRESTMWKWHGDPSIDMFYCNSAAIGSFRNFSGKYASSSNIIDYGSGTPGALLVLDHQSSPGGLATQQITFYDPYLLVNTNGRGISVNPQSAGSGQGDTITFVNPFIGPNGLGGIDAGVFLNGQNTLSIVFVGGDIQGCRDAVRCQGGSCYVYGTSFQNQQNTTASAPIMNQVTLNGADVHVIGGAGSTVVSRVMDVRSESEIPILGVTSPYVVADNVESGAASLTSWFVNYGGYLWGTLLTGGTKGKTFMLVDNGGTTDWSFFTASSGTTVTDAAQSWTVNQWAGKQIVIRFSNGVIQRLSVVSNTATTLTLSADPGSVTGLYYLIVGSSGGTEPAWDSVPVGFASDVFASGQGFNTTATSTSVGVASDIYNTINIGDYIAIPNGYLLHGWPGVFVAKVTNKSGGNTLTIDRPANRTMADTPGYWGTPVVDGDLSWIDCPFFSLTGISGKNVFVTAGRIRRPDMLLGFQSVRSDFLFPENVGAQTNPNVDIFTGKLAQRTVADLTVAATIDLTASLNTTNSLRLTPNIDVTLNGPAPIATVHSWWYLTVIDSGTPCTVTFSTNITSQGPLYLTGASGKRYTFLFASNGDGLKWYEVAGTRQPIPAVTATPKALSRAHAASYTTVSTDLGNSIEVTTGSTDRTITLLSGATAEDGARQFIRKVDSGTGKVIVTDGSTTFAWLSSQYDEVEMRVNSSGAWEVFRYQIAPRLDSYTSAGTATWTKPPLASRLDVLVVGGGGGGGSGASSSAGNISGGAGGTPGPVNEMRDAAASVFSSTVTATVGAGGAGGASATGANGNAGGLQSSSSFGTYCVVQAQGSGAAGGSTGTASGAGSGLGSYGGTTGASSTVAANGTSATQTNGGSSVLAAPNPGGGGAGQAGAAPANFNGGAPGSANNGGSGVYGGTAGAGGIGSSKTNATAGTGGYWPLLGIRLGASGGGGWANSDGTAGAGADGSGPGAAGGGGGASTGAIASGKGGNGADGAVYVLTKF